MKLMSFNPRLTPELQVTLVLICLFPLTFLWYLKTFVLWLVPRRFKRKKDIKGETILITGAGSGIGRQLAIECSKHSVNLILLDLFKDPMVETAAMLDPSSRSYIYECDVTDRQKVYETAKLIKASVGKVDILVNNAGVVCGKRFLDLPDEKIRQTMEVNVMAHFWTLKAFLPDMLSSSHGHVVGVASMAGLSSFPRLADYSASKHAVVGLMESLSWELLAREDRGVKLTTVCPNVITTGLFEGTKSRLNSVLTPEYVAREILEGILQEQRLLLIPGWLRLIIVLKWTMPLDIAIRFYRYTGLLSLMDEFKGRNNPPVSNLITSGQK